MSSNSVEKAKFRVSVCGFRCNHETHDHALQVDGKHDEIWISVRYVDPSGEVHSVRTRTMGDAGGIPDREPAGTSGIQTGDSHPAEPFWAKPMEPPTGEWRNEDRAVLPFVIKAFELVKGGNSASIEVFVTEDDMGGSEHWDAILRFLGSDASRDAWRDISKPEGNSVAPGATGYGEQFGEVRKALVSVFGQAGDGLIGDPLRVELDFESASKLAEAKLDGLPKGVKPLEFKGHRGDSADYTVWIRVEKVGPPPIQQPFYGVRHSSGKETRCDR